MMENFLIALGGRCGEQKGKTSYFYNTCIV